MEFPGIPGPGPGPPDRSRSRQLGKTTEVLQDLGGPGPVKVDQSKSDFWGVEFHPKFQTVKVTLRVVTYKNSETQFLGPLLLKLVTEDREIEFHLPELLCEVRENTEFHDLSFCM